MLTVLEIAKKGENNNRTRWTCRCKCGKVLSVRESCLISGQTKSCGCLRKVSRIRHGHCKGRQRTPTNSAWIALRQRCNNPKNTAYKNYGGRGIKVCKRWEKFENFLADMGEMPEGLTIERIDNDGNYCPENCKWATYTEQTRNNRNTKLNPLKVQVIKKLLQESCLTQQSIGDIFGVTDSTISTINTGQKWGDIVYNNESIH